MMTIAASGITVFEALEAAEELEKENISVRVIDCYSINPIDKETLKNCAKSTENPLIISVEDHYIHGGMGDFINAALAEENVRLVKMAVTKISTSGTKEQLLDDAGINASHIIKKVKELLQT